MALDELQGRQRRGSGRLQSQLASRRTIKKKKTQKTDRAGKTFLAQSPRRGFFPIRQFGAMAPNLERERE